MQTCKNCGTMLPDNATFCTGCGTPIAQGFGQQPNYGQQGYMQQYVDPSDHTAEFSPKDISDNKVVAMSAYLLSVLGIIIALLGGQNSPYAAFHARQALKINIVGALLAFANLFLFWTIIVPIASGICFAILFVVQIICFFQVCNGKAKDAPIIGKLGFLK